MTLIDTAPHEFTANFNFTDDGLDPYFAADSVVKEFGGSRDVEFHHDGEVWEATLYYQDSGIVHPGDETTTGTPFELDEIREFRLAVEATGDDVGERSFNAHLRPRWLNMKVENDKGRQQTLDVPFNEGVNVRVAGSNIEFAEYINLLQQAALAVGIKWSYFSDPHPTSNVVQAERYVRVHRDKSGPVHARDGPLSRLGHLLEGDRDGHRQIEQRDMDERGEQLPGYRHQVAVDEQRVREILPNHELPKRWKHYYPREHERAESDPLAHPKVGAIYYNSLWRNQRQKLNVDAESLQQLTRELEESLLSVVNDAGLDVTSSRPYVADAYFEATTSDRDRQVVDLPVQEIRERQESVVIEHVADGLSPVQWQTLETLVTDGGEIKPADIADDGEFHLDSVYRALDGIDDLLDREYGSVELASSHVGELVHDAVERARQSARDAVESAAKAIDAAERGLSEETSALVAWAGQHLESLREAGEKEVFVDVGTIRADDKRAAERKLRQILREGYELWCQARKSDKPWRFFGKYEATLEWDGPHGRQTKTEYGELFDHGHWRWELTH